MTRGVFAGVFFAMMLAASPAFAQKIGVVDLEKAIADTKDGKTALAKLEGLTKAKQKELDQLQNDAKKLNDELEAQMSVLREDQKRSKLQELQKKGLELQDFAMKGQQALEDEKAKLLKPILDRMKKILAKIGKDENFTVILHQQAALYVNPAQDLTEKITEQYNAGGGK